MGSVKDLRVVKAAMDDALGEGIFTFSDRYSVFDWGEMPDLIPGKGAALCMMAAWNFEQFKRYLEIPTHYLGIVDSERNLTTTDRLKASSNIMVVSLSRVIKPKFVDGEYDYSEFIEGRGELDNFVVPLEVIYRRGAPKGSSLFKTIDALEREGKHHELATLLGNYGLVEKPEPGQLFPKTGYDFTTKFESTDRRLSEQGAHYISGLSTREFGQLGDLRDAVVDLVALHAHSVGLIDFDGKHEYRFFGGVVSLADVAGTFDENRFMISLDGRQVQVSKEFLRQYHKTHQPDWYEAVEKAKVEAFRRGIADWKSLVQVQPQHLDSRLVALVGEMYQAGSDRYTGLNVFKVRPLEKVMEDLMPYMEAV